MIKYDELIKRLRNCATQAAPCKTCDMLDDGSCSDTLMKQAADAIEELSMIKFGNEAAIFGMKREIERMVVINADRVPVVHGKWIEEYNGFYYEYKCSVCGATALTKEETMYDQVCSNFCANCGAKMEK